MSTRVKKQATSVDMRKLKALLKDVPEDRQPIANNLYNELLFMQQTLKVLKEQVQEEGPVSMFKQGQQEFLREHPALKAYNTTIQKYSLLFKQLIDLLPDSQVSNTDELLDFLEWITFKNILTRCKQVVLLYLIECTDSMRSWSMK